MKCDSDDQLLTLTHGQCQLPAADRHVRLASLHLIRRPSPALQQRSLAPVQGATVKLVVSGHSMVITVMVSRFIRCFDMRCDLTDCAATAGSWWCCIRERDVYTWL